MGSTFFSLHYPDQRSEIRSQPEPPAVVGGLEIGRWGHGEARSPLTSDL
jgi:hypothetical protein